MSDNFTARSELSYITFKTRKCIAISENVTVRAEFICINLKVTMPLSNKQ